MNFKEKFAELKKMIESAPNKKKFIKPTFFLNNVDCFKIESILYDGNISCYDPSKIEDIYNLVEYEKLDSDLFNKPYYIDVLLDAFNEQSIDIINRLNNNVFIDIHNTRLIDDEEFKKLSKIKRPNCLLEICGWIKLDYLYELSQNYYIDEKSNFVIVVEKIDEDEVFKLNSLCNKFDILLIRIKIKDVKSLHNLCKYASILPENDFYLELEDNIFNQDNPQNARDLILEDDINIELNNRIIKVLYQNIEYSDISQLYEFERNIELIKSHIPQNASSLDIITYVSLFIVNYFKYDYDMTRGTAKEQMSNDINIAQFVYGGKGVCRHFASFTEYLLKSLGIKCERVDGNDHAFNVVEIDNKSYFLDNTWLANRFQEGEVKTLAESSDYLRSNASFGHDEYQNILQKYNCDEYDRDKVNDSARRVISWRRNYKIHIDALKDLFRKHKMKNVNSVENKIESAIPRRR